MKNEIKFWSLTDAIEFWKRAEVQLSLDGFLCGIYGSVLRGRGRDLDLLIIPKRINTSPQHAVESLAEANSATLGEPYNGIMGTKARILALPNGRLVDLQFYKPTGPQDAEALYLSQQP